MGADERADTGADPPADPGADLAADPGADLELAVELADVADRITLAPFASHEFSVGWKPNHTEVTEVDRRAEDAITSRILAARPSDGVRGEELGHHRPDARRQWLVDPIDGTSGYVRGIPVWATLIALVDGAGGVLVGVVSAPALGRRWWATRGGGALADGRPCRVSAVDSLGDAQVSVTLSAGWDALGLTPALVALAGAARRARGYGDFWQHALVAEGALDVAVDAVGVAPYDLAAVRLLVEEAGGRFTDRHGVATHEHDTAISTNGRLHDDVLRRLDPRTARVGH